MIIILSGNNNSGVGDDYICCYFQFLELPFEQKYCDMHQRNLTPMRLCALHFVFIECFGEGFCYE